MSGLKVIGLHMEDPIRFDVYAKFTELPSAAAVAHLVSSRVYASELEARKAINRSTRSGEHVVIARGQGWSGALVLARSLPTSADPRVTQEGYSPSELPHYCDKHSLHYGGCLGCHICGADYVP